MKIFVAVPVRGRELEVDAAKCLLDEQLVALLGGDEIRTVILPKCSIVYLGRNQLATDFLASDCDRLFFLDSDVSWRDPGALLKVAKAPADVVGGAYRYKQFAEAYPVGWLPKPELWANEHGLLEVDTMPTGFLAISRAALERFAAAYPRPYDHHGHALQAFFHAPYDPVHGLSTEDAVFCREWRAIGGSVWLDPMIHLTHHDGGVTYRGCIGDWLRARVPAPAEAA